MTAPLLSWTTPPALYAPTFSTGRSDEPLRRVLCETKRELHSAASSAQSLALTSLARVMDECCRSGWDGYGARAISGAVVARTIAFLNALPASLTSPEIIPEPDGEIAVDWDFDSKHQLSISIGESGPLHFAGVIGEDYGQPRVRHGTEPFEGVVGGDLLRYIHDLHERAGITTRRRAA
jgi:hypothetical protein